MALVAGEEVLEGHVRGVRGLLDGDGLQDARGHQLFHDQRHIQLILASIFPGLEAPYKVQVGRRRDAGPACVPAFIKSVFMFFIRWGN
jgi:hypothetical protein